MNDFPIRCWICNGMIFGKHKGNKRRCFDCDLCKRTIMNAKQILKKQGIAFKEEDYKEALRTYLVK